MRHGGLRLFGPPLGLLIWAFVLFKPLMAIHKSFPSLLLRERGDVREEFQENHMAPIICPFEGHLWWLEPVSPFQQLVLEGNLRVVENMPVVRTPYWGQAILSQAR